MSAYDDGVVVIFKANKYNGPTANITILSVLIIFFASVNQGFKLFAAVGTVDFLA